MINAYAYYLRCAIKNMFRARLRRLKEPKYLIALILGLGYFFLIFGSNYWGARAARSRPDAAPDVPSEWIEWGAIVLGLVYLAFIWVFRAAEPGLFFRPAEIQYLFTAPVTRRQVINYYIVRSQIGQVFSSLILGLIVFLRSGNLSYLRLILGCFLISNVIFLHQTAASLMRASVFRYGKSGLRHNARMLVGVTIAAVVVFMQVRQGLRFRAADLRAIEDTVRQILDSPALYFLFYPLRILGRLLWSRDAATFYQALVPTLGLLALHYVWVIRSDVAFEEASEERSRQMAERIARWKAGKSLRGAVRLKTVRAPFRLGPSGPAATAILWKNLISFTRLPAVKTVVSLLVFEIAVICALELLGVAKEVWAVLALPLTIIAVLVLLFGPAVFRQDLRQDLPCLDILKTLPMTGREVVRGEILAPLAILCTIQWLLCPFGLFLLVQAEALPWGAGLCILAALLLAYPPFAALWLLFENALLLYFPDWSVSMTGQRQGIEAMGMRMLYMIVIVLAMTLLMVPAALAGAAVAGAGYLVLGEFRLFLVVAIAAAGAAVLVFEATFLVRLLGEKYDDFDFATEFTPGGVL